ncbi:MAG: hypothetical protein AcusKO_14490 [Acuticoccus sp.]
MIDVPRFKDGTPPKDFRDLSEFCEQWQCYRDRISDSVLQESGLDEDARHIIEWLKLLADRVCPECDA